MTAPGTLLARSQFKARLAALCDSLAKSDRRGLSEPEFKMLVEATIKRRLWEACINGTGCQFDADDHEALADRLETWARMPPNPDIAKLIERFAGYAR